MRISGLLPCYNEEHIIEECLSHCLDQGIDVTVFDNGSTDRTLALVERVAKRSTYPGRILGVHSVRTQGYEWYKILQTMCRHMHLHLSHYRWQMLIDADGFYDAPAIDQSIPEFVQRVDAAGYNVIDGTLVQFYPTEKDDETESLHTRRLRYCEVIRAEDSHLLVTQERIFSYHKSIDFFSKGGHVCRRQAPKRVAPLKFIYRHYPWTSYEHGVKKVFVDRLPRYAPTEIAQGGHQQYSGFSRERGVFVRRSDTLRLFEPGVQASLMGDWSMQDKRKAKLRSASRKYQPRMSWRGNAAMGKPVVVEARGVVDAPPRNFHFLVNERCNVACWFCNQHQKEERTPELSLEKFAHMLGNIDLRHARSFTFSGGGEPLLNKDLVPILHHARRCCPHVRLELRTNGTLLGKLADPLSRLNLDKIEVSVLAASHARHLELWQVAKAPDVFESVGWLQRALLWTGATTRVAFTPAVSRRNIDELPGLLQRAHALGVHGVSVALARYYVKGVSGINGRTSITEEESLFNEPQRYNSMMRRLRDSAAALGIAFSCDPLFGAAAPPERKCSYPRSMMLVDSDGVVYPCCGGETAFAEDVRRGQADFGNLLQQQVRTFWNSPSFQQVRRSSDPEDSSRAFDQCSSCSSTICLKGADVAQGHFLNWQDSSDAIIHTQNLLRRRP